jgi:16S rRNA (cytosine1402-N4)-methyltransferase
MTQYHNPVLLEDALQGLDIRPEGIYVDVTFGGGGHSRVLLDQINLTKLHVDFLRAKRDGWTCG